VSALDTTANTVNLLGWMIDAAERVNNLNMGRAVFYMNRRIRTKLRVGILEKVSSQLTWDTVTGKRVMAFDGIPIRRTDALLTTEARVV
jgi:hypothetical protein